MQSWLPVENRLAYPKHHFDRRFEPRSQDEVPCAFCVTFCTTQKVTIRFLRELPDKQEVCLCRGGTLRVLLLPFSLKHGRLAHIRSQFSLFRRSPTHKNLPLAIFCTSEQGVSRFCKPQSSASKQPFPSNTFYIKRGAIYAKQV